MNQKTISIFIAILAVAAAGSFYGGLKYDQSKNTKTVGLSAQDWQNLSSEQRQQMFQQRGTGSGRRGGVGANGGFVNGVIISQDDKSMVVKLSDGGSRIVFFSGTTSLNKSVDGILADLAIGKEVTVSGSSNVDGSLTAQNIQIRSLPPMQPQP